MNVATKGVFWFSTILKLLLIPSYRSTDFEVHRNWLAITHSLPFKDWYHSNISQWTLDYPPLFAWWEYMLTFPAKYFDPNMLDVNNLNYVSPATILFQRLTVIFSDLVLFFALVHYCDTWRRHKDYSTRSLAVLVVTFLNAGLFMVDHIHFQYNGLLLGLLVFSISFILQGQEILGAVLFAVLLNMKHIFLYMAPVYFVYLLRNFCYDVYDENRRIWNGGKFLLLGVCVAAVFAVSLGPMMLLQQMTQLFSRLFPFERGLVHAYWAPNFWALYNLADKVLISWLKPTRVSLASMTGGLVGTAIDHVILPDIFPMTTFALTFGSMLPALYMLWRNPRPENFVTAIVQCALSSFMFGWHVHEKAILMIVIPLGLYATHSPRDAGRYMFFSTIANFSLFPLLFRPAEFPVKILLFLLHFMLSYCLLERSLKQTEPSARIIFNLFETTLLLGIFPVFMFSEVVHPFIFLNNPLLRHLEFIPLMVYSTYCSIGVVYFWVRNYLHIMSPSHVTLT